FEGRAIFSYPEPRRESPPTRAEVERLMAEVSQVMIGLVEAVQKGGRLHPTREEIQGIRAAIDRIYHSMQRFHGWCGSLSDQWAETFLAEMCVHAAMLLELDRELQIAFSD